MGENGSHDYKATQWRGWVTQLGLLRPCITPATRMKNLGLMVSEMTPIQIDQSRANHHLNSFLLSLVSWFLGNQLCRCGYSLTTILETKPPCSWHPKEAIVCDLLIWDLRYLMRTKGRQTIMGLCNNCTILDSVYPVLGLCCTRCMLYTVFTHDYGMKRLRSMTYIGVLR